MNLSVVLFFLHNVLATAIIGGLFVKKDNPVFKNFGIALLLDTVAFAAWSFAVISPSNLFISVTIGAIFFLASLVFFVRTAAEDMPQSIRMMVTIFSVVAVGFVFFAGRFIDPADAFISAEGFLFFNLTPFVQMLYIFVLMLAAFPAIDAVTSRLNASVAHIIKYGLIAEVAGGMLLITTMDAATLYIAGWVIGLVYAVLWSTLLFRKNVWSK